MTGGGGGGVASGGGGESSIRESNQTLTLLLCTAIKALGNDSGGDGDCDKSQRYLVPYSVDGPTSDL